MESDARVPFISGWVDRTRVLAPAECGYQLDPAHPGNRLEALAP